MIVYLNGRYLSAEEAMISVDDRGFIFADGVYEVIRSYAGRLFRADRHLQRLKRSAGELRLAKSEFGEIPEIIGELTRVNALEQADALAYIQVTRGAAPRTHHFPQPGVAPTVYVSVKPFTVPGHAAGLKAIVVPDWRWERCDIKTISLLANVLAQQQATEAGADEAIFSRNGIICEGTHSNVAIVKDGGVITPPLSNHILPGITREAALELCGQLGIPCVQETVFEGDLRRADEIMVFATSLDVAPVIALDGAAVGGGKPGPVTTALGKAFQRLPGVIPA